MASSSVTAKPPGAMADGTQPAVVADDGVQAPQLVQGTRLQGTSLDHAAHRPPIEHDDDSTVVVVVLAAEVERLKNQPETCIPDGPSLVIRLFGITCKRA